MKTFTLDELLHEVQKEIGYRQYVYKNLVDKQKMRQSTADERIAKMETVASFLERAKPLYFLGTNANFTEEYRMQKIREAFEGIANGFEEAPQI